MQILLLAFELATFALAIGGTTHRDRLLFTSRFGRGEHAANLF
jgi:hypothetical protein